ncbi:MAG TPA: hypothetical protein VEV63_08440 [Streptosporangiaceae bacterium]|nr:hypothetical protein [Streptosporangiaceae bacterium]
MQRLVRRAFPAISVAGMIVIGITLTMVWPPVVGKIGWALPHDLWGTLVAASRVLHGQLSGLYTQPTGLITLPGGALILVPIVAVIDAAGLSLHVPGPDARPVVWLLAGPYMAAISGIAVFAADAIAEHLAVPRFKRAVLAVAGAVLLWNVTIRWGHPEDAVAVGLLMYSMLDLARGRTGRSAWLFGFAVATQPLVLLALPVALAVMNPRRAAGYVAAAATPGVVLLGIAAIANWHATYAAVTRQPNWPTINHPTLWLPLATPMHGGAVAAGPSRVVAIVVACGCAVAAGIACRSARDAPTWDSDTLLRMLWWIAITLALRSVFEPVMVAYYAWPVFAVAVITATTTWPRLLATSVATGTLTFASQVPWRSPWTWWVPMVAGLAITLMLAFPRPPTAIDTSGSRSYRSEAPAAL